MSCVSVKVKKYYGVYLAYSQYDVFGRREFNDKPEYPRELARVRLYVTQQGQLDCYANTMCPASQTFEASSKEEVNKIVEDFKNKFEDQKWLEENIYPYI